MARGRMSGRQRGDNARGDGSPTPATVSPNEVPAAMETRQAEPGTITKVIGATLLAGAIAFAGYTGVSFVKYWGANDKNPVAAATEDAPATEEAGKAAPAAEKAEKQKPKSQQEMMVDFAKRLSSTTYAPRTPDSRIKSLALDFDGDLGVRDSSNWQSEGGRTGRLTGGRVIGPTEVAVTFEVPGTYEGKGIIKESPDGSLRMSLQSNRGHRFVFDVSSTGDKRPEPDWVQAEADEAAKAAQARAAAEAEKAKTPAEKAYDAAMVDSQQMRNAGGPASSRLRLHDRAIGQYRGIVADDKYTDSQKAQAQFNIGQTYLDSANLESDPEKKKERLKHALTDLQIVVNEYPGSELVPKAHLGRGHAHTMLGNKDEAQRSYEDAQARAILGRDTDTQKAAEAALNGAPTPAKEREMSTAEAARDFAKKLGLADVKRDTGREESNLRRAVSKFDESIAIYDRMLADPSLNADQKAVAMMRKGGANEELAMDVAKDGTPLRTQRLEAANTAYASVAGGSSGYVPEANLGQGRVLLELGRYDQAQEKLETARKFGEADMVTDASDTEMYENASALLQMVDERRAGK